MGLPSFGVYYVNLTSCKDCLLPTTAGKDFFLIFLSGFTHHNGKGFLYFACVGAAVWAATLLLLARILLCRHESGDWVELQKQQSG